MSDDINILDFHPDHSPWVKRVREFVPELCELGAQRLDLSPVPVIPVSFDIRGPAGHAIYRPPSVSFNLPMLFQEKQDFIDRTVPHEVAHCLAYLKFGDLGRGHGDIWRYVLQTIGGTDLTRCHQFDTSHYSAGRKRQRRWPANCDCGAVRSVSTTIRNKMLRGQRRFCNTCKSTVQLS